MDMNSLIHRLPKRGLDDVASTSTSTATPMTSTINTSTSRRPMAGAFPMDQNRPMPNTNRNVHSSSSSSAAMPLHLPIFSASPPSTTSMLGSMALPQPTRMTTSTSMTGADSRPLGSLSVPQTSTSQGNGNGNGLTPLRFIIPSGRNGSNSAQKRPSTSVYPEARAQELPSRSMEGETSLDEEKENNRPEQCHFNDHMNPGMTMVAERTMGMNVNMNMQMDNMSGNGHVNNINMDGTDTDETTKTRPAKRTSQSARKNKNPTRTARSTKSKARPGLRKGKWTEEESKYAEQLTYYFKEGLLPIERGTMLRLYLSQKLNCEPMRITKKFTGDDCIGKQVFRPCSPTPDTQARLMQAQIELLALEAAFYKRLKASQEFLSPDERDDGVAQTLSKAKKDSEISSSAKGAVRKRPLQRKSNSKRNMKLSSSDEDGDSDSGDSTDTAAGDQVQDANAVGLLLDFFYKANRSHHRGIKRDKAPKSSRDHTGKVEASEEPEHEKEVASSSLKKRRMDILSAGSGSYSGSSSSSQRVEMDAYTLCATI